MTGTPSKQKPVNVILTGFLNPKIKQLPTKPDYLRKWGSRIISN